MKVTNRATVPIFPELRPYLDDASAIAADEAEFVITRWRAADKNLRDASAADHRPGRRCTMAEIVEQPTGDPRNGAGGTFPSHVVCAWLGNTKGREREHYLQVTKRTLQKRCKIRCTMTGRGATQSSRRW